MIGHRSSLARGNLFMAHRTGFTSETLGAAMIEAGFAAALVQRTESAFLLTAIGFRSKPDREQLALAQARMLSAPDRPAVLYSPHDLKVYRALVIVSGARTLARGEVASVAPRIVAH